MGPSAGGALRAVLTLGVLPGAVVLAGLTEPVRGQDRVLHGTGALTVADVDADGQDDVLVDVHGNLHTWFGVAGPPWLRRGPTTWIGHKAEGSRLTFSGDLAYKVVTSPGPGVRIYRADPGGQLRVVAQHQLGAARRDHRAVRLRVCPLGFDYDGNGRVDDAAVALLERSPTGDSGISLTFVGAGRAGRPFPVSTPADGESEVEIVGLFGSRGLATPVDEVLCVVSANGTSIDDALGVFSAGRGTGGDPRVTGLRWFGAVPRLRPVDPLGTVAAATYGAFRPSVQLPVPVFHFDLGPSVVFHPEIVAPWVSDGGAWLETSVQGRILDGATADYDGDGADEIVVVEPFSSGARDGLVVTDPHPRAADWQVLSWTRTVGSAQATSVSRIVHAAPADLDGDGLPEMVLSCELESGASHAGSELAVLAAGPARGGRRLLRRVR